MPTSVETLTPADVKPNRVLRDRADLISHLESATSALPRGDHGLTQDRVVLNEYGLTEINRTSKKGTKTRYAIEINSEPIRHDFSGVRLGKSVTFKMMRVIQDRIAGIGHNASDATIAFRDSAANNTESDWVRKRYGGGRTGFKMPGTEGDRLFNDSGRLRRGIFVRENPREGSYTVNVPNNRLDPSTFSSQSQFVVMVERLQDLVPELRDVRALVAHPSVSDAMHQTLMDMIKVASARNKQLKAQLIREIMGLF